MYKDAETPRKELADAAVTRVEGGKRGARGIPANCNKIQEVLYCELGLIHRTRSAGQKTKSPRDQHRDRLLRLS